MEKIGITFRVVSIGNMKYEEEIKNKRYDLGFEPEIYSAWNDLRSSIYIHVTMDSLKYFFFQISYGLKNYIK